MSRNQREGRYMGYATQQRCCHRGHIHSHWHASAYAPLAIQAFSVTKTRFDNPFMYWTRRKNTRSTT
jgi:hypothetical protein